MQYRAECGRLSTRDGWIICPVCGRGKLLKIQPDTIVQGLPVKCKRCGQEQIVNTDAPEPASFVTSA